jgi:hypothetical protein
MSVPHVRFQRQGFGEGHGLSCRLESPIGNARHVKHLLGPNSRYNTSRVLPTRGSNIRRSLRRSASAVVSDARRAAVMSTSGYAFRKKLA